MSGTTEQYEEPDDAGSWLDEEPTGPRHPPARFARGTREVIKADPLDLVHWILGLAPPTDDGNPVDIEAVADAILVVAADGRVARANARAVELTGYQRDDLIGARVAALVSGREPAASATACLEPSVRFVRAGRRACVHHRDGGEISVELLLCPSADNTIVAVLRPIDARDRAGLREQDVAALLEAERFTLQAQVTEIRSFLSDVLDRVVAPEQRGRVFFVAPEAVLVRIDRRQVERVLANLVQNAIAYSPPLSGIVVRLEKQPRSLLVSVVDASEPGAGSTFVVQLPLR